VWSAAERRVITTIPPAVAPFGGEPVFSPNGTLIAMNRYAGPRPSAAGPHAPTPSLVVVDIRTGRSRVLAGTPCDAGWRSFPFSANGALIAGGTFCGGVSVFDVATGRRIGTPYEIGGEVSQIAFSPNAKQIAVASWDSTVTVLNVATGHLVKVLTDNTEGVTDVAYSPDGRYLASASLDDTVRIWYANAPYTLLHVIHQPDPAYGLRFTADGRDILTFDNNGVVREWDTCTACENANALVALASKRTTRKLTPQEQQTFATG